MKTLCAFLLIAVTAHAATNQVSFDLGIFSAESVAYKQVRIAPSRSSFPRAEGTRVVGVDYGFRTTDANGLFTNAMVTGTYDITFTNRFLASTFQITVPSTNYSGILTAAELTTTGTNSPSNLAAYSQAAADARFIRGVAQGTNIITVTNASGVVTVHGTASGGGSATNAVSTIGTNSATVLTGVQTLIFTNGNNTTVTATGSGGTAIVAINSTLYGIQDDDTGATITSDDD
jgi:hypothetical protein